MSNDVKEIVRLMAENQQLHKDIKSAHAETAHIERKMRATLSIRDQFAMAALTGLTSHNAMTNSSKYTAELSYEMADAMLKAREAK